MARVDTLEEAKVLAGAIKAGKVPEDRVPEAVEALRVFSGEQDQRDEFSRTRFKSDPMEGPNLNVLMPKGFASQKAREEFEAASPAMKQHRAAQRGVDVTSGIDPTIRAKVGLLNFNQDTAAAVLDELIRTSIPEGEVPKGIPYAANIEGVPSALTRQEDGSYRYHAIDPVGFDSGDLLEFAGELPQIALETAGGFVGAVAGSVAGPAGTFVGGFTGAQAGTQFGLDARVAIARMAGVPEDLIDNAVTNEVRLREAVLSAAGDVAGAAILGTTRVLKNARGGRVLSADDVERVRPQVEESLRIAGEFKDRTGRDLNLSIAQLTGDADMAAAEAQLKRRARGEPSRLLRVKDIEQRQATSDALRDITEQNTRLPPGSRRPLADVTEDVQAGIRGQADQSRRAAETAEEDLTTFMEAADQRVSADVFVRVQDNAATAKTQAHKAATEAWDQYRKEVEWKQGEGSNVRLHSPADSPIKKVLLDMDEQSSRALLKSSQKSQSAFVKDAGLPEDGPTEGLAGEWLDPRELHFTLSDLKRRARQADKAADPDGFRAEDMRRVIEAIEKTIREQPLVRTSSGRRVNPEKAARIRDSFQSANDLTWATHSLYDSDNMRSLLKPKTRINEAGVVEHTMDMPAGMIYKRMFKEGDSRFLNDALDATGHNPSIKASLAEELVKKHRSATKADLTGDAHRRFMDDHESHFRLLGLDPDNIRGAGALAQAARAARKHAADVGERLAKTFGKKLTDDTTDVLNIAKELQATSRSKATNVMQYLDRVDPDLATQVRDHSLLQLRRDLSTLGDTELDFKRLWNTVEEHGDTLTALHGKQYVDDLRVLKEAERLVERGRLNANAPGGDVQPVWLDISRSLLGPLSKKQRFITAVQRTNKRMQGGALKQIITSPDDLHRFVKLRSRGPKERAALMAADNLFALLMPSDNNAQIQEAVAGQSVKRQDANRAAGSSLVPGRPSPAEAVGGNRVPKANQGDRVENTGDFVPTREGPVDSAYRRPDVSGPAALHTIVEDAAINNGIDPHVLMALAQAESSFKPKAKAPNTSASGLMQVTVAAAQDVGMDWDMRFDPAANADGGAKYLKRQLDRFDGDLELALLAYHDGGGNVNKYLSGTSTPRRATGGRGLNYVKKIMRLLGAEYTLEKRFGSMKA